MKWRDMPCFQPGVGVTTPFKKSKTEREQTKPLRGEKKYTLFTEE